MKLKEKLQNFTLTFAWWDMWRHQLRWFPIFPLNLPFWDASARHILSLCRMCSQLSLQPHYSIFPGDSHSCTAFSRLRTWKKSLGWGRRAGHIRARHVPLLDRAPNLNLNDDRVAQSAKGIVLQKFVNYTRQVEEGNSALDLMLWLVALSSSFSSVRWRSRSGWVVSIFFAFWLILLLLHS